MSETSKKMGRCYNEMKVSRDLPTDHLVMADAIDRLAEDVAAVKEAVCDGSVAEERDRFFAGWAYALNERAKLRAEVERLRSLLPPTAHMGVRNGPGEGSWSVFACKVVEDRDEARAEVSRLKCSMTETSKDRDAAIRERDEARAEVERLKAELAARQAADVQRIGWIARHNHAPPVGKYVMCRWDVEARQGYARQVSYGAAKRGPDGMWLSPTGVEKIAPMHWMPLPPGVEGGDEWEQQPPAAPQPAQVSDAQPAAPAAGWLTQEERRILSAHVQALRDQRRAADVAAIKAKVDAVSPEDVKHFVESEKAWVTPPWQRAKWDEALAIICNGGDWGRGNNFDHGVLGALVIWADKEMDRLTAERDAAIRDRDEARAEVEKLKESRDAADRLNGATLAEVERLKNELYDREQEILSLRADTVERYTPPAAPQPEAASDAQPDAWAVRRVGDGWWAIGIDSTDAEKIALDWNRAGVWQHEVVPLYAAPQPAAPAAGWLTQEERRILSAHVQALRDQRRAMERGGQTLGYSANPCGLKREADAIDALLARAGSLPVVEVPVLGFLGDMTGREQGIVLAYRDALDKAGVAWKAVPRE